MDLPLPGGIFFRGSHPETKKTQPVDDPRMLPLGPLVPGHQWHFSCAQDMLRLCQGQCQGLRSSWLLWLFWSENGKTWLGKIGKNWGNLQTQRLLQGLFPYPMVIFHMWKRRWLHGSIPGPWNAMEPLHQRSVRYSSSAVARRQLPPRASQQSLEPPISKVMSHPYGLKHQSSTKIWAPKYPKSIGWSMMIPIKIQSDNITAMLSVATDPQSCMVSTY